MFTGEIVQCLSGKLGELDNAQGIAANGKRTSLVLHDADTASQSVAVMGRWVIELLRLFHQTFLCVCANIVNNTPGVTNSYVLPSCCTTCLSIDGFIVHARI